MDEAILGKVLLRVLMIRQIGVFVMVPFIMAVPPIIGWFLGSWLDRLLGTHPFLAAFMLLCGLAAGFREVYRIVKRFGNDIDNR